MARQYKLSDSESESDNPLPRVPSDEALEQGLRDEVAGIYASGNMENLTVKRVRLAAEKKMGLTEGFFKTTDAWKGRSDQIIKDEVVRLYNSFETCQENNANLQVWVCRRIKTMDQKTKKRSLSRN